MEEHDKASFEYSSESGSHSNLSEDEKNEEREKDEIRVLNRNIEKQQ